MHLIATWLRRLPSGLNWLLSVLEPLLILGVTSVIGYVTFEVVFRRDARLEGLLKTANDNWKACLILLVILFYRTVRNFLEQAEEAFGVKRKRALPLEPLDSGSTTSKGD